MKKEIKYKYKNALLIDDNPLDNFVTEKMLEVNSLSKNISVSLNGKIALDHVLDLVSNNKSDEYPDIMFVDLNMPVMNGFEFIENFKKINDKKFLKCKVVILTSSVYNDDKVKAEKLDANIIFANKPLTEIFLNSL